MSRALAEHDPGGSKCSRPAQRSSGRRCSAENHTLKRALTDPHLLSGIGNAYSDEILHRARLSPVRLTRKLDDEEIVRLHAATQDTLTEWTERLRAQVGDGFPGEGDRVPARDGRARPLQQPCPTAARRSSASSTPPTRRTTAPRARPVESCWPTGRSRGCSRRTGRRASTSSNSCTIVDSCEPRELLPARCRGGAIPYRALRSC